MRALSLSLTFSYRPLTHPCHPPPLPIFSLYSVPFWCPENEYTKEFRWIHSHQNESNTRLIFSEPHPDDALRFYRMLFDYGIANGMSGFENDYLDYNYLAMPYLRKTHGAANKWLAGINKAALERNLPVQIHGVAL